MSGDGNEIYGHGQDEMETRQVGMEMKSTGTR